MAKYIGEREIEGIENNTVKFTDGMMEDFTEKQLSYIVTEEPKDATAFRDIVINEMSKDVLKLLEEHDIKKGDLNVVLETVVQSYNVKFYEAVGKAFGTYEEGKYHKYFDENIKISDIKRVMSF